METQSESDSDVEPHSGSDIIPDIDSDASLHIRTQSESDRNMYHQPGSDIQSDMDSDSSPIQVESYIGLRGPKGYRDIQDAEVLAGLVAPTLRRHLKKFDGNYDAIDIQSDRRPRRIWDVCANRVIPTTWFPPDLCSIANFLGLKLHCITMLLHA